MMISRLLLVKEHLVAVLEELGWDVLTVVQWKQLQAIHDLLQPFAHHTNIASSEKSTSIAMVLPILKELSLHLDEMAQTSGLIAVSQNMLDDLNRRFRFVSDPLADNFDPLYVASTLINPSYRGLLDYAQVQQAKKFLLDMMKGEVNEEESNNSADQLLENESQPPAKRFKHLSRVSDLLSRQEHQDKAGIVEPSKEEQELDQYMKTSFSKEEMAMDPFDYWITNMSRYSILAILACELLAMPASTAPIERVFSYGGEATKGKRNRLSDKNLEREILLHKNKKYLRQ